MRVAAVIPYEGGLLTVRHEKDGVSYHLLPGGGVDAGETIAECLVREVREETGLVCEVLRPLFINDSIAPDASRHVVQLTFLARVTGGDVTSKPVDPRVAAVEIVPLDGLSALDLRPPMAGELRQAAADGFSGETRYLGPLWSEFESGTTETGTA